MTIEATLQSIDASLQTIAIALDSLAAVNGAPSGTSKATPQKKATGSTKPSKAASQKQDAAPAKSATKAKAEPKDEGPELADVRRALTTLQKNSSSDAARALLEEVGGAKTLSKLPKDKYQDVIDAATE